MSGLCTGTQEAVLDGEGSGNGRAMFEKTLRDGCHRTLWMRGESDVPSTMGVVEDLLAGLGWFLDFQVVIFVYPIARDLDGGNVRCLCARLDFTDDQIVCERRYPDSVRAREL